MAGRSDKGEGGDRSWFVYSRTAGRITAAPASWQGWAAFAACIAANVAVGYAVMRLTLDLHPLLRVLLLSAVLVAGILLTVKLMQAKGRRVE
jgi:hypothetical protein